jgi:hypothetical protein
MARDSRELGPIDGFPHQIEPEDMRFPEPKLPYPRDFLEHNNDNDND